MNERIRKLKNEAVEWVEDWSVKTLEPDELNEYEWSEAIDKKFSELMVRECVSICEDHPGWTGRMIGEQIKEHFGVKE
jgi:transposase